MKNFNHLLPDTIAPLSEGHTVTLPSQNCCCKIGLAGIASHKQDRYCRTITTLMLNTQDVKLAMLQTANGANATKNAHSKS